MLRQGSASGKEAEFDIDELSLNSCPLARHLLNLENNISRATELILGLAGASSQASGNSTSSGNTGAGSTAFAKVSVHLDRILQRTKGEIYRVPGGNNSKSD